MASDIQTHILMYFSPKCEFSHLAENGAGILRYFPHLGMSRFPFYFGKYWLSAISHAKMFN